MLLDLFDGALADRAGALALDDLTHRQVHDGALRVARKFEERGIRAGDRVAIYSENRQGFVFAYLAALRMGAIAVPVNVLYRSSDLSHVLSDAQPSIVVCSSASAPFVQEVSTQAWLVSAAEIETWARDASIPASEPRVRPAGEDPAVIVYTSGTTGASKGAILSHGNLEAIVAALVVAWRWQASDILLVTLPLFHVHGLIAATTASLAAGGRMLLRERFDARDVLDTIAAGTVTMFFGVPTMYVRLLENAGDTPAGTGRALPPIRLYVSGSAALSAETHRAFEERFGAQILERYGATEFGFALSNRYAGPRVAGSVGIPMPGVRVRVAAPDGVEPLRDGEIGELLVAGANVFEGYWKLPQESAASFAVEPDGTRWYRSGDLAQYDAGEGVYRIVGRIKELIITGGFNVYPREVEDALERLEGVRACAVVGKPDPARGELPVAFVEVDGFVDTEALLILLRSQLASFKIPKEIRVLETLPRNAMGKLDKPALRRLL
ncbi:MAG TPA: AMP-binding protein [Candidatus Acidoferrales bacterium]|nr:AMP-binding protein [Candidatus Acidoferrales bacterium]